MSLTISHKAACPIIDNYAGSPHDTGFVVVKEGVTSCNVKSIKVARGTGGMKYSSKMRTTAHYQKIEGGIFEVAFPLNFDEFCAKTGYRRNA